MVKMVAWGIIKTSRTPWQCHGLSWSQGVCQVMLQCILDRVHKSYPYPFSAALHGGGRVIHY